MKKQRNFRLSEAAQKRLAELAKLDGINETQVLENLLMDRADATSLPKQKIGKISPEAGNPVRRESRFIGLSREIPKPSWKK